MINEDDVHKAAYIRYGKVHEMFSQRLYDLALKLQNIHHTDLISEYRSNVEVAAVRRAIFNVDFKHSPHPLRTLGDISIAIQCVMSVYDNKSATQLGFFCATPNHQPPHILEERSMKCNPAKESSSLSHHTPVTSSIDSISSSEVWPANLRCNYVKCRMSLIRLAGRN